MKSKTLLHECLGETLGTFILVFFGCGAVHASAITGAQAGLWQVAIVWAMAVALAIYAVGAISGAHINPAMTIVFAIFRKFPARKIGPFIISQLIGAFLAAALLFALYVGVISRFEQTHNIVRGQPGSERTAMVYGEYFPNPGNQDASPESVSEYQAMLAEGIGTAMLAFFVLAVTDRHNPGRPNGTFFAVMIGLAVAIIISIIAPLTQAGLNPARDFGPRVFACFAGWGSIAIPGPRGGFFTVYILSPILGGILGGAVYEFLFRTTMQKDASADKTEQQGES